MTLHSSSYIRRVIRRLGLDPKQRPYFFYIPNLRSPKGSIIAMTFVLMLVMSVLIPVAMSLLTSVRQTTNESQLNVAGAENAAKAGLEDALGWFVRQNKVMTAYANNVTLGSTPTWGISSYNLSPTPTPIYYSYVDQPFAPAYDGSNPAYSDTSESTTLDVADGVTSCFYGIANEYPVDASSNTIPAAGQTTAVLFARYEVGEQVDPVPGTGPTYTPSSSTCHDITGEREGGYVNGDGLVWAINSTGYIYKRLDYQMDEYGAWKVPYNVYPNKVLATAKAYTELRKITCNLPVTAAAGEAAIYVNRAASVFQNGYSYLNGKQSGAYALCAVTGTSASATLPNGAASTNFFGGSTVIDESSSVLSDSSIFGMSIKDIQFIADNVGNATTPITIGTNQLSYYNGSISFTGSNPVTTYQNLNGSGILIVNGNLTLNGGTAPTTNCYFAGIVFVTGNLTITNGADIDGVVIMGNSTSYSGTGGAVDIAGTAGEDGILNANPHVVTEALKYVAQYREDISARRVLLAFPGI